LQARKRRTIAILRWFTHAFYGGFAST